MGFWRTNWPARLVLATIFLAPISCSAQWTLPKLLNDPSETAVKSAKVAAAKSGGFHTIYANTNPWEIVYRRYQNGVLGPRKVVRTGFVPNPAICEAGNGNIHLAWEDWDNGLQIGWSMSTDGGNTFVPFQKITTTGDTKHPHLAPFGPDTSADVVMSYWQAANKNLYWGLHNGVSWSTIFDMGQNADNEYEVFGMCRSLQDGTIYRSYGTKIGGVLSLCYRRYNGSYWEPQVVVVSPGFFARHDIAVNPIGQVMVSWEQDEQLYFRVMTPGAGWGPILALGSMRQCGAITAIPGSNDFYVVYLLNLNSVYGVRYSGSGFLAPELISVGIPQEFTWQGDVDAGPDGTIYATWEYWGSGGPQQYFAIRPGGPPPDATLTGYVRDQFGQGISGATIAAGVYSTVSGAGGYYSMQVAGGIYTVTANKQYYTGTTVPNVSIPSGQTTALNLTITASPPAPVTSFNAVPSSALVRLSWTNPTSGNFQATTIRYKTTGFPTGPADGVLVCDRATSPGQSDTFTHTGLTNGVTCYYAAFSRDDANHYSSAVLAQATPLNPTIAYVKQLADGSVTDLSRKVVSANFVSSDGCIYIREQDGSSGIRVATNQTGLAVGDVLDVTGTVITRLLSGYPSERQISAPTITKVQSGAQCRPVAMVCRNVGGAANGRVPGVRDGVGTNNMGLLVTISGKVTYKSGQYIFVDDGSRVPNIFGISTQTLGVMVKCPSTSIPAVVGDVVSVTGIVEGSIPSVSSWQTNRAYVHMRDWDDLVMVDYTPTTGKISGTVTDGSGSPVSGATVSTTAGGYSATTGAGGIYTISDVAPGTYGVTASKSGYTTQTVNNVAVVVGQTTTANFTLNITVGTISGTVRDGSGNPLIGATVATNTGGYSTTSSSTGGYTLSGVLAGSYNVTASKSGYTSQTVNNVTVTAAQTTTVNFNLNLNAGTISGTVKDTNGNGISGALVSTSAGGYSTTSGAGGSYTLSNVAAGTYSVTASKSGYSPQTVSGVVVTASQTTAVNLTLTITASERLNNGNFEGGFFYSGWWGGYCANGWGFAWKGSPASNSFYCEGYNFGGTRGWTQKVQGKADNFEVGIAQEVSGLTPGASYTFSADSYRAGSNYQVFLAVRQGTGYGSDIGSTTGTQFPNTTGAWVSQSVSGTVGSQGAVTAYLWVKRLSGSTADVFFDNASFMSW